MIDQTRYSNRPIISKISLRDFETRKDEITRALVAAAESEGFFAITDHGIPAEEIRAQFAQAERFFALPDTAKPPFDREKNAGWEAREQVRPSTGLPDQKESYQIRYDDYEMKECKGEGKGQGEGVWVLEETLPGFRDACLAFMRAAQAVSEKIMVCLARGLRFTHDEEKGKGKGKGDVDEGYFTRVHDLVSDPEVQTVLRLLHYFPLDPTGALDKDKDTYHRAGAHTDWGLVTLLFQRPGEDGLEICCPREGDGGCAGGGTTDEFGRGETWTKVEPLEGEIICNIGDLLMRWSDDRFKSTLHRVRTPRDPAIDNFGPRYSMAYFNQPTKQCRVQGPLGKYPPVSAADFIQDAIRRNYAALEARMKK
ncbi:oxoglutarate/iron-dependent oxygenase [Xylariaceae sp. FL0594]|nr:oxoglutarate/iron-dependent oxygenase [Xylariaceae sp. FL0594]